MRATFLWRWPVRERGAQARWATLRLAPFEALPDGAAGELAEEGDALLRFVEEDATSLVVEVGAPAAAA